MSLKTWKKEFYPIAAGNVSTMAEAVEHSIQKWEGLRAVNLVRHDVDLNSKVLRGVDDDRLYITHTSCALCIRCDVDNIGVPECMDCPLFYACGEYSCDSPDGPDPYGVWVRTGDPEPMIKLLVKARKWVKEQTDERS